MKHLALLTLGIVCIGMGCRPVQSNKRLTTSAAQKSPDQQDSDKNASADHDADTKDADTQTLQRDAFSLGSEHPLKNLDQLRSSIESCVGKGVTGISRSMLQVAGAATAADAQGRLPFLDSSLYSEGMDVLTSQASFLLDPALSQRYGIDADRLATSYLRSLELVANVVAHNCPAEVCRCASTAEADAFVQRCLPSMAPTSAEYTAALNKFKAECAGGAAGMRRAVASLLASYAFAVSH